MSGGDEATGPAAAGGAGAEPAPPRGEAEPPAPRGENEAQRVYLRFRRVFGDPNQRSRDGRRRKAIKLGSPSQPFGTGREPRGIADVLASVTSEMGWNSPLAQSELMTAWPDMVGDELSAHSHPISIDDGTLTVQCDSTAWATQLRLMRGTVTTTIVQRYPEAGIQSVRFLAPNAPSWKRGPRSVPGRGPRDTYG
jgi:predicted nucleic acid-binding Zn ribbon protein